MEEHKWYFIMVAVAVLALMGGAAISEWRAADCRIEYAKSNRTVAEIKDICK